MDPLETEREWRLGEAFGNYLIWIYGADGKSESERATREVPESVIIIASAHLYMRTRARYNIFVMRAVKAIPCSCFVAVKLNYLIIYGTG